MDKGITFDDIKHFSKSFDTVPKNQLALNAVAKNGIGPVALDRTVVNNSDHTYSHLIETPKEATNQKHSGRCWLFAGVNTLRQAAMKKLNVEKFELSQAYLMFWDKLEKANFFLENIIETRDEPLNGRLLMWLLSQPLSDGGQWDMFGNLIKKYGVVPKSAMVETYSSSESRTMNALLVAKLREDAQKLRELHNEGASENKMRQSKGKLMEEFYRMLTIHLGKPPSSFFWEWRDKDKKFQRYGDITPQDFFKEFVGFELDDMVCLINAPTEDKPYNRLYTVQYLGNVVGGECVRYLNVPMKIVKKTTVDMIVDGNTVWFGCDAGKMMERNMGILNKRIYNYDLVYGTQFKQDKANRLDYGQSRMTHAMVFTGVDLDNAKNPKKWRVENSWGPKLGDKGYMMMSNEWFEEFLYEVMVDKKTLSPNLLKVLETEPIVLPPWDPMGSLANAK